MTQPNVISLFGSLTFEHRFEECPLFRNGEWRTGLVDGTFEVTYDFHDNDWYISNILLDVDNGKLGAAARGKTVSLDCMDPTALYQPLLDAITDRYSTWIDEHIADELAERGYERAA